MSGLTLGTVEAAARARAAGITTDAARSASGLRHPSLASDAERGVPAPPPAQAPAGTPPPQ